MSDDSRKLFYAIGEVADIFQINDSTLRFWEKEFPTVIKPKKNAKGTRFYTKEDIESIRLVHFLVKEKGMTLAGARKKLKEDKKGLNAQQELADKLKRIKAELLKLQNELGKPAVEFSDPVPEPIAKVMHFQTETKVNKQEYNELKVDTMVIEEAGNSEKPIIEESILISEPENPEELDIDTNSEQKSNNWSGELF